MPDNVISFLGSQKPSDVTRQSCGCIYCDQGKPVHYVRQGSVGPLEHKTEQGTFVPCTRPADTLSTGEG